MRTGPAYDEERQHGPPKDPVPRLNAHLSRLLFREVARIEEQAGFVPVDPGKKKEPGLDPKDREWITSLFVDTTKIARIKNQKRQARELSLKEKRAKLSKRGNHQPVGSSLGMESDPLHLSDDELERLQRIDGKNGS